MEKGYGWLRGLRRMAILWTVCGLWSIAPASGATLGNLPTTRVGGQEMYYYDVRQGENIYDVMQRLGLTREQILASNPWAADGLSQHSRLLFPLEEHPTIATTGTSDGPTSIITRKGETLYGIAHQYGLSVDQLIAMNPEIADGLRPGMRIRLAEVSRQPATKDEHSTAASEELLLNETQANAPDLPARSGYAVYRIRQGQTLYGIAKRCQISLEDLFRANPTLDQQNYQAGQYIYVPVQPSVSMATETPEAPTTVALQTPATDRATEETETEVTTLEVEEPAQNAVAALPVDTLRVGVMLPFMLAQPEMSRTTQLFTEFYRGMLMAADTLSRQPGAPVKIYVYDTEADLDTLRTILDRPEIGMLDMVIAPDNSQRISEMARRLPPETFILNIFGVKDDNFRQRPNMIQANIPHEAMYAHAIDAFTQIYADVQPVFLMRSGGTADKETFTTALRQRLDSIGKPYREVRYDQALYLDQLEELQPDSVPVVFIPASGSRSEFARISSALLKLREQASRADAVSVWGYPEWVTFRGENFDDICNLSATIYSRYFADDNDPQIQALKARYRELFGVEMIQAVPTQGILGYDMGTYAIEAMRGLAANGQLPTEFLGVQSQLNLIGAEAPADNAAAEPGMVNDALYIIRYLPGGVIKKTVL